MSFKYAYVGDAYGKPLIGIEYQGYDWMDGWMNGWVEVVLLWFGVWEGLRGIEREVGMVEGLNLTRRLGR